METTIGGKRLGSGNKMKVAFRNYERSTHDLSYLWRSTMASGTLVPFMSELALPGDTFDIKLGCSVLTHPTIGPLFGSYKVQLDVFAVPIRLYQAALHMNMLNIGMKMANIKLPQIDIISTNKLDTTKDPDNQQINPSSIFSYLNIRGLGLADDRETDTVNRKFNAIPYLAYWDIYKNYYANKQEEIGAVIHTPAVAVPINIDQSDTSQTDPQITIPNADNTSGSFVSCTWNNYSQIEISLTTTPPDVAIIENIYMIRKLNNITLNEPLVSLFKNVILYRDNNSIWCDTPIVDVQELSDSDIYGIYWNNVPIPVNGKPYIKTFPLENIDKMRMKLLQAPTETAYIINNASDEPYKLPLEYAEDNSYYFSLTNSQEGLGLKTYQSDLFNNWLSTEWIDGVDGISAITAVSTAGDSFTIDELQMSKKIYDMLNRIALSGGSYDDWLDAVYTHERSRGQENPAYLGGLIKELAFQEVISNAATADEPLGTLAGRGRLSGKNKGGRITISVNEPSYILGLVSITPRVDYSQGNQWDMNLKTFDDFHKPALDAIGFQDLITDQLLWSDTRMIDNGEVEPSFKSLGKQPAWLNYMTDVNRVYGGFAEEDNAMYMVLNRRYEKNPDGTLKDGTTYIDPAKYNNIFAQTSLDAQNFWVQISNDIIARRKMSAKIIPNL